MYTITFLNMFNCCDLYFRQAVLWHGKVVFLPQACKALKLHQANSNPLNIPMFSLSLLLSQPIQNITLNKERQFLKPKINEQQELCKLIQQTREDLNDYCLMKLYCKTCEQCIGGYYESDQCYPDVKYHTTHEWQLIQNRCRECNLISKNTTALQSHLKRKHGL